MVDRVTVGLFDLSSLELNETTRRSLVQSSQQLRHLCSVLEQLLLAAEAAEAANEDGLAELRTKCEAASLVSQYLKVIMWFFDAGLLPEVPEDQADSADPQFSNRYLDNGPDQNNELLIILVLTPTKLPVVMTSSND